VGEKKIIQNSTYLPTHSPNSLFAHIDLQSVLRELETGSAGGAEAGKKKKKAGWVGLGWVG